MENYQKNLHNNLLFYESDSNGPQNPLNSLPQQHGLNYYPMPGYGPYYPPPPMVPSVHYFYMDMLRTLSTESELRRSLPHFDQMSGRWDPRESQRSTDNIWGKYDQRNISQRCKNNFEDVTANSQFCLHCQNNMRCTGCSQPIERERSTPLNRDIACNCCQQNVPAPIHVVSIPHCKCNSRKSKRSKSKQILKTDPVHKKHTSKEDNCSVRDILSPKNTNKDRGDTYVSSNVTSSCDDCSDSTYSDEQECDTNDKDVVCKQECDGHKDVNGDGETPEAKSTPAVTEKKRKSIEYFYRF